MPLASFTPAPGSPGPDPGSPDPGSPDPAAGTGGYGRWRLRIGATMYTVRLDPVTQKPDGTRTWTTPAALRYTSKPRTYPT